MAGEYHIINKISLQLNGVSTQAAFQLQQDMNVYLQHFLSARLHKWLDRYFPADQWVHIDKLHVNIEVIGSFSQKKLEYLIEEELQKQLERHVASGAAQIDSSEAISPFRAWLYFLEKGHFPWWYNAGLSSGLEKAVIAEWQEEPNRSAALLQEAIQKETVRRRFVLQSSRHLFDALLILFRLTKSEVQQWEKRVLEVVEEKLEETYKWRKDKHRRNIVQLSIQYAFLHKMVSQREQSLMVDGRIVQTFVAALEKNTLQAEMVLRRLDDLLSAGQMQDSDFANSNTRTSISKKGAQHIIIGNAGIVLFHPYLEYFFKAVDLLDSTGQEFLYPGKAVQLLHFLATSEAVCNENETMLNKIICGLEAGEHVYTQYPLSLDEQTEGRSLLEAVIRNWPTLKSTSPEGLQETFLQRTGKLSWKDDHWLLQVEQKTVDVLLSGLQWPLSVIRLPWMRNWLQVEWT